MQQRQMGSLGEQVSLLGFGAMRLPTINGENSKIDAPEAIRMMRHAFDNGVNYVDSAWGYHGGNSELIVAQALRDGYRQRVQLATKSPTWLLETAEDFSSYLDRQLQKLETDHIDYYLQHGLGRDRWLKYKELGVFAAAQRAKDQGKIKHYGFSFHDKAETFQEIIAEYPWDFCQIQYNYLDVDNQAGRQGLQAAHAKGMAVVVMEPLRGGRLAAGLPSQISEMLQRGERELQDQVVQRHPAEFVDVHRFIFEHGNEFTHPVEWAFRWLADQPEVSLILSGMSTMAQVEHNLAICSLPGMVTGNMSPEERNLLAAVAKAWQARIKVNCTDCKYCMPCPQGVDIPACFSRYNTAAMFDAWEQGKKSYSRLSEEQHDASHCIACGACEAACPQKLSIINALKELDAALR
ncbi:MAG: aldo/keto reductase [Symbiobacteriaceae bacterium]|nr:aldo/keto reductase [Symbiobacteriaceae bacterium]